MDGYLKKPEGWEEIDYKLINGNKVDSHVPSERDHAISGPRLDPLKEYNHEVVLVLAGGLNEYAKNHQWVTRRLDLVLALYHQKPRKIICLGGGTYHKPPCLNHLGFVIHESTACIQYLIDAGVKSSDLMREWSSYDTIANAFFSLINYIIPMEIDRVLVITSDFHMLRTKAIFNWIYSLTSAHTSKRSVDFLSVNSLDLDQNIINARSQREKQSLANLQDKIINITTLKDFHTWFFNEHKAYNCDYDDLINHKSELDNYTKSSY